MMNDRKKKLFYMPKMTTLKPVKIQIPKSPKITIPKYFRYPPKTRRPVLYPKKSGKVNKRVSRRTIKRIYRKHKRVD